METSSEMSASLADVDDNLPVDLGEPTGSDSEDDSEPNVCYIFSATTFNHLCSFLS